MIKRGNRKRIRTNPHLDFPNLTGKLLQDSWGGEERKKEILGEGEGR